MEVLPQKKNLYGFFLAIALFLPSLSLALILGPYKEHTIISNEGLVVSGYAQLIKYTVQLWTPLPQEWSPSVEDYIHKWEDSYAKDSHCIFDHPLLVVPAKTPDNYYHWTFDISSRILLRKRHVELWLKRHPDGKIWIGASKHNWQEYFTDMVGFSDRIVWGGLENNCSHISPQIYILKPTHQPGYPTTMATNAITKRSPAITPLSSQTNSRILIYRLPPASRTFSNLQAIINLLSTYGFDAYDIAEMPISSQQLLFQSASIIVAPHGAALTNLVFTNPGTRVIEIFPPYHHNECYKRLSKQKMLNYIAIDTVIGDGLSFEAPISIIERHLKKILQEENHNSNTETQLKPPLLFTD